MPKYIGVICLIFIFSIALSGCRQSEIQIITQPPQTTDEVVIGSEILETSPPDSAAVQQPSLGVEEQGADPEQVDWVPSDSAAEYLGQVKTVRVDRSHCSYKPNINGAPTFCNDQPYPDHSFTYLIWGEDLGYLDQTCVLVVGEIVEYEGKPQIQIESDKQLQPCDE